MVFKSIKDGFVSVIKAVTPIGSLIEFGKNPNIGNALMLVGDVALTMVGGSLASSRATVVTDTLSLSMEACFARLTLPLLR